ncbi:MAG: class I SAM-dependent methyltransferase [Candidatus Hadarchaeum sp.]|uniref:class I SAM-dependent methyltransferase n=1 Tax=Candidatus Hadarchaeum sp. TaxID=2883567 RepID=UPI003D11F16A
MYRKKMEKAELVDRIKLIQRYCKGKKVLDVGCVGHTVPYEHPLWLHKYIREVTDQVLGIDIEAEKVKELREKGYNMIVADALSCDLGEKFDVIVAGQVIEHLDNPGIFLENMKRHLSDDGVMIISTDNAHGAMFIKDYLIQRPNINPQHCMFFSRETITELLRRHQLEIVEFYYYDDAWKWFFRIFPQFASNFIFVCRPKR